MMISVTRLDGKKYWINPHMIESMEQKPDLTITFLSGKTVVLTDDPQDVIDRIVSYRRQIGIYKNEVYLHVYDIARMLGFSEWIDNGDSEIVYWNKFYPIYFLLSN